VNKIELHEGYSPEENENQRMAKYWEEDILEAMSKKWWKKSVSQKMSANSVERLLAAVWLSECDTVMAIDKNEHGGTSTANNTYRKVAYKHMFQVINGRGQKGIQKCHSQCVETGVPALFPDDKFMGFSEA
jgi:hypothetical protein